MKRKGFDRGAGFWAVFLLPALGFGIVVPPPAHAAKALPDLRFVRHSVDPEHPAPGQGFRIEVTVGNQGKGDAQYFRVEARRGQSVLGRADFQGLKPGGRDTQGISLTYPGGTQTVVAAPGAPPKEFCLELLINPLKNAGAPVDSPRRLCVEARTVALPSPPSFPASVPGEAPAPTPTPTPTLTPGAAPAPPGPIEIKIASLDVSRDKFELELENKDKKRDLRNPLVEVEINQAGKKKQLYKDYLPNLPADGTRIIRIPVPEDTKPTDSLEIKVNKMLIGQKGLKGLIGAELDTKKIRPTKPEAPFTPPSSEQRQLAMLHMNLQINGMLEARVPVGGLAVLTWSLPEGATSIFLRVRNTEFPAGETCSDNHIEFTATDGDDFRYPVHPDVGWFEGGAHSLTLGDSRYVSGNTYYVMGCFWNRETVDYTGDWTNQVRIQYAFAVAVTDLSIVEMKQIPSGRDRRKIAIVVKAQPIGRGNPARDSFPVVLMNGNETVWEGTGRVGRFLSGWGDWIVTDYVPRGPVYLKARINLTPYTYDEAGNTGNNVVRKAFNWESAGRGSRRIRTLSPVEATEATRDPAGWFGIRAVTRVRGGPDWSRVNVFYNVTSGFRCRVEMWASRERGTSPWDLDDRVRCTGGNTEYAEGRLYDEFLCQVADGLFGVAPFRARETAHLECRGVESGNLMSAGSKEWVPRASVYDPWGPGADEFPDYFIPFAYIKYRDGKPRALTVNVSTDEFVSRDGMYTPRVTVDLMTSPGTKVASRVYQLPSVGNPRHVDAGTFTIDLREGHGWQWNVEEPGRRYSPSWVQITLGSVVERHHSASSLDGSSLPSNNTYRIDLLRVHPRP